MVAQLPRQIVSWYFGQIRMAFIFSESEGDKLKETICLGLLTDAIDKTRLADHGPDVQPQRPKSVKFDVLCHFVQTTT